MTAQELHYISYDVENGLPSPEVYDIEIDNKGFIWITTDRGVVKYDGYNFKTYSISDGLLSNTNLEIYKDLKDNLWFTGINGTLSKWDGEQFKNTDFNKAIVKNKTEWIKNIIQKNDSIFLFVPANSFREEQSLNYFRYNNQTNLITKEDIKFEEPTIVKSNKNKNNFIFEKQSKAIIGNGIILNNESIFYQISNHVYCMKNHDIQKNNIDIKSLKERNPGKKTSIDYKSNFFLKTKDETINIKTLEASVRNSIIDSVNNIIYTFSSKGLIAFELNNEKDKILSVNNYLKSISFTNGKIDANGNFWLTTENKDLIVIPNINFKMLSLKISEFPITCISNFKNHLILKDSKSNIYSLDKNGKTNKIINAEQNSERATIKIQDRFIHEGIKGTTIVLALPTQT